MIMDTITDTQWTTINRAINRAVKANYPESYVLCGFGWCGPQWGAAQLMDINWRLALGMA